jgi:phosphoglycerol transferase MdoB-like AlkP superfamily enzyme
MVSAKKLILSRVLLAVALSPMLVFGTLVVCIGMMVGTTIERPHLIAASVLVIILVSIVNWKCWEGCRAAKSLYTATYLLSLCAAFTIAWVFWHWLKGAR